MKPNVELLRKTLGHIKVHPEQWDQAHPRLNFAGWAAWLAGGEWYLPATDFLHMVPEDDPAHVHGGLIHVRHRARRLLGLTHEEADDLFHRSNNLHYLEQAVEELCAKAEPTSAAPGAGTPAAADTNTENPAQGEESAS